MTRRLVVLGSTGSIGTQTLEVASAHGLEVAAIGARRPGPDLADQARRFPDSVVVAAGGSPEEQSEFASVVGREVQFGDESISAIAAMPDSIVINGIVGAAGLAATLAALEAGNRVGLANKESLVAGGPLVRDALERGGGELIPVDSEHSALFQCLVGEVNEDVARLVLTASGGPFRGWDRGRMDSVSPEQALKHPTWDMGPRVTIDSATLFNKGLEVIEAHYLFGFDYDRIRVVVHPQSILHSFVEFIDGSWKGHFGQADMRIPIQYAITSPRREESVADPFSLAGVTLEFEEPDRETFPALDLAYAAGRKGGSAPAVLNAADEVAVDAFLSGRIRFPEIAEIVERTLEAMPLQVISQFSEVIEVDRDARKTAERLVAKSAPYSV